MLGTAKQRRPEVRRNICAARIQRDELGFARRPCTIAIEETGPQIDLLLTHDTGQLRPVSSVGSSSVDPALDGLGINARLIDDRVHVDVRDGHRGSQSFVRQDRTPGRSGTRSMYRDVLTRPVVWLRRPGCCFTVREMAEPQLAPLDPSLVDALVDRLGDAIVERVIEAIKAEAINFGPTPEPAAWLNAREVARRLGVTREWVYEHADELGASRIGTGPRPRLRFPAEPLVRDSPAEQALRQDRVRTRGRGKPSGLIPIRAA